MKVLVIAPHPDDEAIGCGGAVCRHVLDGDEVHAVFLTSGELGLQELSREHAWKIREGEAQAAARVLQLTSVEFVRLPDSKLGDHLDVASDHLAPLLQKSAPATIYLPHPNEWHPDHKACLPIVLRALGKLANGAGETQKTLKLRGYEIWTPLSEYEHVENITDAMATKLRAIQRHRSQIAQWDYIRAVRGLNEYRGVMAGRCRYAEVFADLRADNPGAI